jgi:hypothetical protein
VIVRHVFASDDLVDLATSAVNESTGSKIQACGRPVHRLRKAKSQYPPTLLFAGRCLSAKDIDSDIAEAADHTESHRSKNRWKGRQNNSSEEFFAS